MFQFHRKYFLIALAIFLMEVCIALFVSDKFIRPYIGDLLVVVLIYYVIKSFLIVPPLPLAISVLIFSYSVEILQYFNVVEILKLQNSKFANILIGNTFCWEDLIVYTIGIIVVVLIEKKKTKD